MSQNRTALVYVDMLGVRASWLKRGRDGAEESFHQLQDLLGQSLAYIPRTDILEAVIESDSVAVKCRNAAVAVNLACTLFKKAFNRGSHHKNKKQRVWLRGVILPISRSGVFRQSSQIFTSAAPLIKYTHHRALLDAIAIEKSGFRGMRCLIKNNLVTDSLHERYQFKIGEKILPRFRHLKNSGYPKRIKRDYQDILWMTPFRKLQDWELSRKFMANRLRYAGLDAEELNQAAATQIVFHECDAMISRRLRPDVR